MVASWRLHAYPDDDRHPPSSAPGLDDGARDLDTSLAMAEMATADGITHIVCTPHASHQFIFSPKPTRVLCRTAGADPSEVRRPLTLGLGCDFHLRFENIADAHGTRRGTPSTASYLLIEFPACASSRTPDPVYQLALAGMTPIITHPERNPTLRAIRRRWRSGSAPAR